jgi:L-2-hydroxyglutarate oxidase LhgO
MEKLDVFVVGAGAVGLAVARALALAGREVIVLEREKAIGQGVSSRNSEVIHGGLYYPTGSLKAKLCVRGKELLYPYLAAYGVGHLHCGKWVVASDEGELDYLKKLEKQAALNGVPTEWLDGKRAMTIEPELRCVAALSSPTTGLMDSHGYMLGLQGDLENAGGMVALDTAVLGVNVTPEGLLVQTRTSSGEESEVLAKTLVNSASLHACELARSIAGLDAKFIPKEYFAKGSYFSLTGKAPFSRLIYPIPGAASLGTHYTLDLGGQGRFGPDIEWLAIEQAEQINYAVDPKRGDSFYESVRKYWPALADGALAPSYSGVRPKIHGSGEPMPDFLIQGPATHGIRGLVNLFGIESPGLTSSMAIAEHVRMMLADESAF